MVAQILYGLYRKRNIRNVATMGHSLCPAVDNSRDHHVYSVFPNETNIDVLHTLCVHPVHNQFRQYPLCSVDQLWQSYELHQLLLGLVEDLFHWLLK
jgi:hypothetical protein